MDRAGPIHPKLTLQEDKSSGSVLLFTKMGPCLNAIVTVLPPNGFCPKSNRTSSVVTSLGWETTYRGPAFKRRLLKVDFRPQQQPRIPALTATGFPGG